MRVLMLSSDRDLFKEGSSTWARHREYGALFKEIHVIVFSHRNLGNKNTKIGDNVFIYPTNHIFKLFYLWNIYKIVKNIISSLGISNSSLVITSQDPFESGLAAWLLKKIYKIPLHIQIHTDFLSPYFWKESVINKFRVILAKFLVSRADGIRVVSGRIKNSLVASGYSLVSITVLPIFVDVGAIKKAPVTINLHEKYPQFDFIILMASRLTKEKNIGLAIEAMSELVHPRTQEMGVGVKNYPKLGLIIVGSGPEENNLKSLILNLKLENNVVLESFTSQDTLFSYYKTADLFLLTSNYEGYGRTVIEAMTSGLPVLMTDVGLAGEGVINGQNGLVVPVGDKGAMISSIRSLTDNKLKREALSNTALKIIEALPKKSIYLESYRKSFYF